MSRRLLVAALLALLAASAAAMFGMGGKAPPKAPAVKADIPLIRCQVCEAMVKQAREAVKALRADLKPKQKLSEADIMDRLDKLCDADAEEGEWIARIDIQESRDGAKLTLKDMGAVGECGAECRTVARACEQVMEALDVSELSEALYGDATRAALTQAACFDAGGACARKPPPAPKDRPAGPAFVPMAEDALQRSRMMRSLKASGMSGTMYDRQAMQNEASQLSGDDDDDDGADGDGAGGLGGMAEALKAMTAGKPAGQAAEGLLGNVKEGVSSVVGGVKDAAGKAASAFMSTLGKLRGGAAADEL